MSYKQFDIIKTHMLSSCCGGNMSWKTAKHRAEASAPLKFLLSRQLIKGKVLDFGCGYGKDVEYLRNQYFDALGYDPYYFPMDIKGAKFDTIICTYVLNVISETERENVIKEIQQLLKPDGTAYLTIRTDIKEKQKQSHVGTVQYKVELSLPIIRKHKRHIIYELRK